MTRTNPETNEEKVFQILGLKWINGEKILFSSRLKNYWQLNVKMEDGHN
jgi:hypothetical protein